MKKIIFENATDYGDSGGDSSGDNDGPYMTNMSFGITQMKLKWCWSPRKGQRNRTTVGDNKKTKVELLID